MASIYMKNNYINNNEQELNKLYKLLEHIKLQKEIKPS